MLSPDMEILAYAVLDVLAKPGFGFWLLVTSMFPSSSFSYSMLINYVQTTHLHQQYPSVDSGAMVSQPRVVSASEMMRMVLRCSTSNPTLV